jgi:hypothetical protein
VWRCLRDRKSRLELAAVFDDDQALYTNFCASTAYSLIHSNISGVSVKSNHKKVSCSDCALRNMKWCLKECGITVLQVLTASMLTWDTYARILSLSQLPRLRQFVLF